VIAGLGSVLGAVGGFGMAVAVLSAYNRLAGSKWPVEPEFPIQVPWWNLLVALVVVPGVAMLGAGLLTRSRLPIERRM
jgi:putative ABC transport system permease protein